MRLSARAGQLFLPSSQVTTEEHVGSEPRRESRHLSNFLNPKLPFESTAAELRDGACKCNHSAVFTSECHQPAEAQEERAWGCSPNIDKLGFCGCARVGPGREMGWRTTSSRDTELEQQVSPEPAKRQGEHCARAHF